MNTRPPIAAEAARKALTTDPIADAADRSTQVTAALDAQELQELERAQYYGDRQAPAPAPRRGFLRRLLRR
jgi:hypothetical protein